MKTKENTPPTTKTAAIVIGVRFLESASINEAAREVPVLIIKEGMGNAADRHFYTPELLNKVTPLFEGVKAYANHPSKTEESDRPERDIRDIVGWYHSAKVVMVEGKAAIQAILKVNDGAAYDWAWNLVKEAAAFAKKFPDKDLVGISINAWGASHAVENAALGGTVNMVDDLTEVQSADIVTQAGAGGGFRLREAVKKALAREASSKEGAMNDLLKKHGEGLKGLHEAIMKNPEHAKAYGPAMEALMAHHAEMAKAGEAAPPAAAAPSEPPVEEKKEAEQRAKNLAEFSKMQEAYAANKLNPTERLMFEKLNEARVREEARKNKEMIEKHISEAKIPEAYADDLRVLCTGKDEADVKRLVESRKKLVESVFGNRVTGAGANGGNGKPESKFAESAAKAGLPLKKVQA